MDDDQQFCLRWNNHQSTLISVFDTLLEKGIHVDCTLAAEGRTLRAHKVVLSACSPYFESVLSQQYDKHPIIILKDVKFAELRAMMDYMYRGEVNISQDQLGALLKAAESLQIKGLSDSKPPPPSPAKCASPPPPPPPPLPAIKVVDPVEPANCVVEPAAVQQRGREGSASPRRRRKKRRSSVSPASEASSRQRPPTPPAPNDDKPTKVARTDDPDPDDDDDNAPKTENDEIDKNGGAEPKPEYADDPNDDSVEDLTVDEEADSDGEPCSARPNADGNAQGFPWQFDRSQEDMNITQDGQRDIPGSTALEMAPILPQLHTISATDITTSALTSDTDSALLAATKLIQENLSQNNNIVIAKEEPADCDKMSQNETAADSEGEIYDFDDIQLPDESEVFGSEYVDNSGGEACVAPRVGRRAGITSEPLPQFECRHCGKRYRWKSTLRRHESVECGGKPPAHACPYCSYRAKQRGNLGVHIRKHHNAQWGAFADTKLRKIKRENKSVKYE